MSNIKVAVRVRPINKRELDRKGKQIVDTNGDNVSVTNIKVDSQAEYGDSRERVKTFSFDYCYDSTGDPQSSQQQMVFQDLGTEILQAAFEGYNACVFAYGQTSTGKTFTMTGSREDPGLIPRICEGLFSHVDDFEASENVTFCINISYLEIYNERVRDLLRPSLSQRNEKYTLKVREHPKDGPYVQDLSSHVVKDNDQIQTLLDKANESRTTAATYMHDHSSRSHAIVTVTFIQAKLDDDLPHEIVSKIHLVDLAGSERADPNWSLNYKGRLKEGSNINKSLVTLGNVIKTLAEKSILSWSTDSLGSTQSFISSAGGEGRASPFSSPKRTRLPYIPYRDSVLTWLLKDSLGGNSKTIMIATISPASICYNETISTLRYAQRAKNIVNKPKINEDASVTLIRELRLEIDRLKQMLAATHMGFYPHNDVMYVVPFQKSHEEGEGLVTLKDSDSALEKELQKQEDRANKLTQTWIEKWMETHEIIKESDLSITGLHRKTSSMGVLIDSQMPHLIGMDSDILSTGVVIYHLKEGKTLVGREDAKREQDIVLSGPGIQREHCFIKNLGGSVTLYPNRGSYCIVNGLECKNPILLKQGDSVILGKTQMFRFNNPAEAVVLRQRRASQENILDVSSSFDMNHLNPVSDLDPHRSLMGPQRPVPAPRVQSLYASTEFCLQLESQYQTETEKIERAKDELEKLKQEHQKAEEQRQLREEKLWMTHNKHILEIENERKRLTKLKEETYVQRQKAEQDLQYAKECLEREREAFHEELQSELFKLKSVKTTREFDDDCVFSDSSVSSEIVCESIRRRKLSLEGKLKTIIQKEIVKSFSHRQTEKTLQKQTEDLEDEFELSKHQVENQLGKIREIEEQYRQTDADHYTQINRTEEELEEIQRREEQLELYIEEKQDLLNVKTDRPRPLRTACSAEILTSLEIETEFSEKTSSMLALNRGSVGDLPAISHQFSLSSMMSVNSESSDSQNEMNQDKFGAKYSKISSSARSVTDRLYKKTTPKFKYEPKLRKKTLPIGDSNATNKTASKLNKITYDKHQETNKNKQNRLVSSDSSNLPSDNSTLARKRHMKSSTSLASVPEALSEGGDEQIMHSTPDISQVIRRRNKANRKSIDDEFRRHSEPAGDTLADAFEKYTKDIEKSRAGNPPLNYIDSLSEIQVPSVIVSDHTYQVTEMSDSQEQECQSYLDDMGNTMEDDGGQKLCHVTKENEGGGMECELNYLTHQSQSDLKDCLDDKIAVNIVIDNVNDDENSRKLTNFHVNLVPIIDISYCEGESLPPIIPAASQNLNESDQSSDSELYLSDSKWKCASELKDIVTGSVDTSDTSTDEDDDDDNDDNDDDIIGIKRKRESKSQKCSTSPSKMPKSEHSNYEWLVNAFSRLSEENLLDFDDANDSYRKEQVESTDSEYQSNYDEVDDENVNKNKKWNKKKAGHDNNTPCTEITEQDRVYYSDSFEEDSLDGSKATRDVEDEDMSYSPKGSDLCGDLPTEDKELSDYDELIDDDDEMFEGRREMYIQYPNDFPGSLLYSIKEESVPVSPDLSEPKDFSPDISSAGTEDNYLSQVVVLGHENQALVTKIDHENCQVVCTINDEQCLQDCHQNLSGTDLKDIEQGVRSETNVKLSADMNILEESSSVSTDNNQVNDDDSNQISSIDPVNYLTEHSLTESVNIENVPKTDMDQTNVASHVIYADDKNSDIFEQTKDLNIEEWREVKAPEPFTAEEMENYLSDVASAINQTINIISDSGKISDNASFKSASSLNLGSSKSHYNTEGVSPMNGSLCLSTADCHSETTQMKYEDCSDGHRNRELSRSEGDQPSLILETSTNDFVGGSKKKPETRTLGVSTSPDLVSVSCGEEMNSDDSLQEVQEELLVLQEAMDIQNSRSTITNGNSLSSARKATRRRAMEKRGSGVGTESEDLMSDDITESQSKPSLSRPDSASRRRRRQNNRSVDRTGKRIKGLSSDEYVTSENDSVYSDDSSTRKPDGKKHIPLEIAKTLTDCIDELTESIAQNDDIVEQNMENSLLSGYSNDESKQEKSVQINGTSIPNLELPCINSQNGSENLNDSQEMSWRSSVLSEGHSLRPTSETRDASQQTDSTQLSAPQRSPMSTQTDRGMFSLSVSPISAWNSVDKCIKSPQGHSDSSNDESSSKKKLSKTKKCKLSDLSYTVADTWSSGVYDVSLCIDADMESGSESDGDAVVMETETCSPATPSTHDHFFESAYTVLHDPPSKIHSPVKYEVTIKPEETNIMYNVEKTEYKSYGLQSPSQGSDHKRFPDSINVNIVDRTSNVSENRHETITRQHCQINQAAGDSPSGNIVSERTFRANKELSSYSSNENLEVRSERTCVEEDEQHFIETTCDNPPVDKAGEIFSPRESVTSDYGTMIYDRRSGVSAAYDSDDIDSLASYGKYVESHENTPRTMKTCVSELTSENLQCDTELVNKAIQDNGIAYGPEGQMEVSTQQHVSLQPRLSFDSNTIHHDASRSSEDIYVSAEMSRTSSASSDYKTPQQSPRKDDMENTYNVVNTPDLAKTTASRNHSEDIKMLKTVSVNTESQQKGTEQIRETLKSELQKKIDDLKYNRKNRDDSAISSDYTDGDSVSVSPRTSFHECDKPSRLMPHSVEVRTTKTDTTFEPSNGAQSYLPKLVDIENKSVQKTPLKDSGNVFDDEDYEKLMTETSEYLTQVQNTENLSDSDTVTGCEQRKSTCIDNEMFEDRDASDRSLSPGEVVTDDLYEQFASGLNSGDEVDTDIENRTNDESNEYTSICNETIDVVPEGRNSAELLEMMGSHHPCKQKSPSLSSIRHEDETKDYRRSVSENCIDQYEEAASLDSSSSNDSIVFVFMGQSHTRESMEQLKHYTAKQKEYKVHESDDNILSQNQNNVKDFSYRNNDIGDSNSTLDSQEEVIQNMEKILLQEDLDSQENSHGMSEEYCIDSQEVSDEFGPDSQEISEVFGSNSQDISQDTSSMDKLDQQSRDSGSQASEIIEEIVEYEISTTEVSQPVESEYNDEEQPLRHRFGIDESILPIPTRSVSTDNLPKKISSRRTMHRSRSTSLLDVEKVEKKNTSSENEGIFPPNVDRSGQNSTDLETNFEQFTEANNVPATPAPSIVDETEYNMPSSINQEVLYSSLIPIQRSLVDHNGNIEEISPSNVLHSDFTSVGTQVNVTDCQTQTESSVLISADGQVIHLLPGLDSPLRAQSMQTLQDRITHFNMSQDSQNWYNLSSLMLETLPLLRNINQRLPGTDISQSNSMEHGIALETTSLATQTSNSLEEMNDAKPKHGKSNIVATATQTSQSLYEKSNIKGLPDDSVFSEVCIQTDIPGVGFTETSEISIQTDLLWSTATTSQVTETTDTLTWNLHHKEPQTTITSSSTMPLFSVNQNTMITQNQKQTIQGTTVNQMSSVQSDLSKEDDVCSVSSEEIYTDTCVMFYDFVNKCYVQNVENYEWQRIKHEREQENQINQIVNPTGTSPELTTETVSHKQLNGEQLSTETNVIEQTTINSQSTPQNDDVQINRGVRINPKYSEYVYRTSPKQPETRMVNEVKAETSMSAYSYLQQNEGMSTINSQYNSEIKREESPEIFVTEEVIINSEIPKQQETFSVESGAGATLSVTKGCVEMKTEKAESLQKVTTEKAPVVNISKLNPLSVKESIDYPGESQQEEVTTGEIVYFSKPNPLSVEENITSPLSVEENITSPLSVEENIVSPVESPREEITTEEIVYFTKPNPFSVEENIQSPIESPREEITTEEIVYFSKPNPFSVEENIASPVESPREEITTEEIVYFTKLNPLCVEENVKSPVESQLEEMTTEEIVYISNPNQLPVEEKCKSPVESPLEEITTEEIVHIPKPNPSLAEENIESPIESSQEEIEHITQPLQIDTKTNMSALIKKSKKEGKLVSAVVRKKEIKDNLLVTRGESRLPYTQPETWKVEKYNTRDRKSNGDHEFYDSHRNEKYLNYSEDKSTDNNFLEESVESMIETQDDTPAICSLPRQDSPYFRSPLRQKPVMEKFIDVEHVVEDIVSPRKEDKYSLIKDSSKQAGIRQHTIPKPSNSSTQSQSDSFEKNVEIGQSGQQHSYQTKTLKKRFVDDRGDDSSDEEGKDEVFEQLSEHHHHRHDDTQVQTILTEREHVIETEFYVPDIEASQAEMDALKEEHDKTMSAIKKAAEERRQRTDELKNKTKKVIETEMEMTKELENLNEEKKQNENKQVTFDMNAVVTREFISEDSATQSKEDLADKTSPDDYIYRSQKSSSDDTESKLQKLETVYKDYVKLERELKRLENEEKLKADLVDDVLSDSEETKRSAPSIKPSQIQTVYKVQTNIVPELPIMKSNKKDIKFMPTYSSDYKQDRIVPEDMIKSVEEKSENTPSNLGLDRKLYNVKSEKVPVPIKSDRKPVISRSISMDANAKHIGTRNMGVEVSVDSSDDYTQTEGNHLPLYEPMKTAQRKDISSNEIKIELDRLHKERVEIIELLALNYLPSSLTVEMLEAKLNYCTGQTDLLLDSLDDMWNIPEYIDERHSSHLVTKEYLIKYREDLRKSKNDLKICKEQLDIKSGKGRGRPIGRNRDLQRLRRQAEIEAFKVERKLEQQSFTTVKTLNKFNGTFDAAGKKSRSVSPQSNSRVKTMTPSEHAAYLINLRKQVVKATEKEDVHHRISRSCSPFVGRRYDTDYSPLPSPRSYSSYGQISMSHHTPVSVSESREDDHRLYSVISTSSPRNYSLGNSTEVPTRRWESYNRTTQQTLALPFHNSRSMSPTFTRYKTSNRSMSPTLSGDSRSSCQKMEQQTLSTYNVDESQQLLREIQEARQTNQMEILKAEETLNSYNRYDTSTNSHAPYTTYTSDLLNNSNLSGSYELYDDQSVMGMSRSSSCRSLDQDSNSVHSYQKYDLGMFHTRPIRSSDIKSRIIRQRRRPRT